MKVLNEAISTFLDIETLIDILDGSSVGDIAAATVKGERRKNSYSSLADRTKNLTAIFPVIISDRLSLKTAEKIAKALEYKYATMLQMAMANRSFETSADAADFLRNYHTNLNGGNAYFPFLSKFLDESLKEVTTQKVINENFKENLFLQKEVNVSAFSEDKKSKRNKPSSSSSPTNTTQIKIGGITVSSNEDFDKVVSQADRLNKRYTRRQYELNKQQAKLDNENRARENPPNDNNNNNYNRNDSEIASVVQTLSPPKINSHNIKKVNNTHPITINIPIAIKASNEAIVRTEAILGVKVKLYPVDSYEISERIFSTRGSDISLFNFIRATTGEIKFWRDFVFALSKAKLDANMNAKVSKSKIWKSLERRSNTSKIARKLNLPNLATAITTLAITAEEVDYLDKEFNINLMDAKEARFILEKLNLLSLIVVDESLETVQVLMDTGNDDWEPTTFKAYEKDEEMDYKQMVKLLAKAY